MIITYATLWFILGLGGWCLYVIAAREARRLRTELADEILRHRDTKIRTGDFGPFLLDPNRGTIINEKFFNDADIR